MMTKRNTVAMLVVLLALSAWILPAIVGSVHAAVARLQATVEVQP